MILTERIIMTAFRRMLVLGLVVTFCALGSSIHGNSGSSQDQASIPYVVTHHDVVRDMLWMGDVGQDDVVYDLGSGDGRIVIAAARDFGARRAVGVEIDPELVRESRQNAREAGVADRVKFIEGDLFSTDFRGASVVALYLGHGPNLKLRPKLLRTLNPGARIVSHGFGMGEWKPEKSLTIRVTRSGMYGVVEGAFSNNSHVPDYTGADGSKSYDKDKIMMWVVPASVAGIWHGKVQTENGTRDVRLVLRQRFSHVRGKLEISGQGGRTAPAGGELWGSRLTFGGAFDDENVSQHKRRIGRLDFRFRGHVRKNSMRGVLQVSDDGKTKQQDWVAHREESDYCGTWQWPDATGETPVRLRIKRSDDQYSATYMADDKKIPVHHFYEWGGGFYFAVLVGRTEEGFIIEDDTGWLIGQSVVQQDRLRGRIEFYPYQVLGAKHRRKPTFRDWQANLVQPSDEGADGSK
jgi:SAM-dependent methyltransferase